MLIGYFSPLVLALSGLPEEDHLKLSILVSFGPNPWDLEVRTLTL